MSQLAHQSFPWDPSKLHFEFAVPNRLARLKALVLYIGKNCEADPTFSETKLYKILFYSDFEAYARYGTPITGMPYKKFPFGPAPANFGLLQDEMLRDRTIRVVKSKVHNFDRQRILPLVDPDITFFTPEELAVAKEWIRFFWNMTAKEVSRFSHGMAWKLAKLGELIPYDAVFISDDPVTPDEVDRVKELAKRHGWKT